MFVFIRSVFFSFERKIFFGGGEGAEDIGTSFHGFSIILFSPLSPFFSFSSSLCVCVSACQTKSFVFASKKHHLADVFCFHSSILHLRACAAPARRLAEKRRNATGKNNMRTPGRNRNLGRWKVGEGVGGEGDGVGGGD